MRTVVIVPAHNEEKNIGPLLKALKKVRPACDIVVVNDASQDHTREEAEALGVTVLDLPVNLGIGGAVQTGYQYAHAHEYDLAIQVDGDGQHDPGQIPRLLQPLLAGQADLAIGSRFLSETGNQSSFYRRMGIRIIRLLLLWVSGLRVTDPTSGFRACNRRVIAQFAKYYPVDYPEPESLVAVNRKKLRIAEVDVTMHDRKGGVSSIQGLHSIYYMFKVGLAIIIEQLKSKRVSL